MFFQIRLTRFPPFRQVPGHDPTKVQSQASAGAPCNPKSRRDAIRLEHLCDEDRCDQTANSGSDRGDQGNSNIRKLKKERSFLDCSNIILTL